MQLQFKRILAVLMAITMMLGTAAPAFAESAEPSASGQVQAEPQTDDAAAEIGAAELNEEAQLSDEELQPVVDEEAADPSVLAQAPAEDEKGQEQELVDNHDSQQTEEHVLESNQQETGSNNSGDLRLADEASENGGDEVNPDDVGTLQITAKNLTGTTQDQPFIKDETGPSQYFRIPSLFTLNNGWQLAVSDIRWRTTADSPQNLDTVASVSKDGGKTWDYQVVNYFDDMSDKTTGQSSASFIDPAVVQGKDGKIYMVVDACPSYVGLMWGNRMGWESSGFDEKGRLIIFHGNADGDAPTDKSVYQWRLDMNAEPKEVTVGDTLLKLYPIVTEADEQTGTWVDAELNVYSWDGVSQNVTQEVCVQQAAEGEAETWVQKNLFYRQSDWKVYPVFYIMLRTGEVQGDTLVWGEPKLLDIKLSENEAFTGVCPGVGVTTTNADGSERILFPVYDNATGKELASVIYSDDGGVTWHRGNHADNLNGTGKSSESQIVNLPNGDLRMYSRNTVGCISYTDSQDGGVTWGPYTQDEALKYTSNCMVSFINLDGFVWNENGTAYGNLIAASYPRDGGRKSGVVRIGSMDESTGQVTWLNSDEVRYPNSYMYSCLTQIGGNALGLLYETQQQEWAPDYGYIFYEQFTVEDILGTGWHYSEQMIEKAPVLQLSDTVLTVKQGWTGVLSVSLENIDVNSIQWSSDAEFATLQPQNDQKTVAVKAVKPGTQTIACDVSYQLQGKAQTTRLLVSVYVSSDDEVFMPEDYGRNEGKTIQAYLEKEKNVLEEGVYAIYAENSGRILYHANGTSKTDQLTSGGWQQGTANRGNELKLNSGFAATRQQWKVAKVEGGYTLESCDQAGYYLSLDGAGNNHLPVKNTPTVFQAAVTETGNVLLSAQVDGVVYYLNHNNKFGASENKGEGFGFYQLTDEYLVLANGLQSLANHVETLKAECYEEAQWQTLQQALADANRELSASHVYANEEEVAKGLEKIQQTTKTLYLAMCDQKNRQMDAVATPVPSATATPAPEATATPAPGATATPAPEATATPAPSATATPAPEATTPSAYLIVGALNQVSQSLQNKGFKTVEQVKETMTNKAQEVLKGVTAQSIQFFDLEWTGDVPASGVPVELPYPTGTGKDTHDFVVLHMMDEGNGAGQVEVIKVTENEKGLYFVAHSFSPYAIAWTKAEQQATATPAPGATATPAPQVTATPVPVANKLSPATGDSAVSIAALMTVAIGAAAGLVGLEVWRKRRNTQ